MIDRAESNGAWFLTAQTAALGTRPAVERGAWAVARALLEDVERFCGLLKKPERVQVAALREAVERGMGDVPVLPDEPSEVGDALPEDPEAALELLIAACRRWPADEALVVMQGRALVACALEGRAEALLRTHVERHPEAEVAVCELGRTLLGQGRLEPLRALVAAAMQGEGLRTQGLWLLASSCLKTDDLDGAAQHLGELLALDPDASVPRHRLANIEQRRGRFAEALEHLDRLVERAEPGEHDWDRMTVATIVGAWDRLRGSARRLGLEFEGLDDEDGPLDTPMGLCKVRFVEEDGTRNDYFAERRSPVCARVVQMAGPRRREHFADLVAFDAGPLNPRDRGKEQGEGEGEPWTPIFPVVHVVSAGGFRCWSLDGTHPGEEAWARLVEALEALGGIVEVRSDERYEHVDPSDENRKLSGVYAYACMPRALEPGQLHARLHELTEGWEHPLVWPEIVEALPMGEARDRELARVAEVTDRYAL
jgi:tetratricopeptide (TPR) repeat protein